VVVQGRLDLRAWVNSDNVEVTGFEIDATHLGHDLARGTSHFTRTPKREPTVETGVQAGAPTGPEAPGEEVAA
jgi:single-strand DNA-binding protein